MVRVLSQDGFLTTSLDPKDAGTKEALWTHFKEGLYAAACIARRENGHWHWVILSGNHGSDLLVGDSLRSEEGFYREPHEDFMNNHVLNVLTIRADPNKARSIRRSWQLHVQGWRSLITSVAAAAPWAGIALPLTVLFGWPWLLKRFATKLTWAQAFTATSSTLATCVLGTFFLAYVVPLGFTIAALLALLVGAHFVRNSVATS